MELLNQARQIRANRNFKEAGRAFYSLAQNQNEGGRFGPVVRPGTTIANAAKSELADMKAKGEWDDAMLDRLNDQ
jgi:hypothetical protein